MQLDKLEVKSDSRGSLVEAYSLPNDGQVFYVIAKPHEMRGGHYHLRKTERFLVICGEAEIAVKDRTTDDVMKVNVVGERPMLVTVTPNNTHTITASDVGVIFMVWVDEKFNDKDPDTYMEEL